MTTPQLGIRELEASQSQPEVIVNAGTRTLEAAIQIVVIDKDLTTPPASPASNARYLIPAGATAAWAGHANDIAYLVGTVWAFLVPQEGWLAFVRDEDNFYLFDGATWDEFSAGGSITIIGADVSPPESITNVASIEFVNALVEDLGGGNIRVTPEAISAVGDLGMFFPGTPITAQLMFKFISTRAFQFPANFAGSYGHIGTNPTSSFTMNVSVAGSLVGTIVVSTGGAFTFATSGGVAVDVDPGERVEIAAPVSIDATAADIGATLLANIL